MKKVRLWVQEEGCDEKSETLGSGRRLQDTAMGSLVSLLGRMWGHFASPVIVSHGGPTEVSNMIEVLPHGPYLYEAELQKLPIFRHVSPTKW